MGVETVVNGMLERNWIRRQQAHSIWALLAAHGWRMLTRVGLWMIERQINSAAARVDIPVMEHLLRQHAEMATYHADHCERLQHLRAGR